jgi:iron complex outermembrane recepter protein
MNGRATLPPPQSPARRAALGRGLAALAAAFTIQRGVARKLDKLSLKIAASAAPMALAEFIRQTGLQVLFDFDAIRNFSTHEVSGQFDADEALFQMFEGSGLVYEFINERTVTVRPRSPAATPASLATRRHDSGT